MSRGAILLRGVSGALYRSCLAARHALTRDVHRNTDGGLETPQALELHDARAKAGGLNDRRTRRLLVSRALPIVQMNFIDSLERCHKRLAPDLLSF